MNDEASFGPPLRKTTMVLFLCAASVTLCYFFVDRPVDFLFRAHGWNRDSVFQWLTDPPPILQAWAPVVLAVCMVRRAWRPFQRWELAMVAACVSLILADQFKESLAFAFGRTWPDTWVNNNPSLIRDGAYGFHPFHGGIAYASFPSGHTARMGALAAIVWIAYPTWRWACVLTMVSVAAGLLGMNYHFTGDVIAGGFVGGIVGTYTAYGFELVRSERRT